MDSITKRCTKCGEWKNKSDFSPDPRKPCGVQPKCKKCSSAWAREYRKTDYGGQRGREYSKAWKKAHPEEVKEKSKKHYAKHKEYHSNFMRSWFEKNKEHAIEKGNEWRKNNPDKVSAFAWNRRKRVYSAKGDGVSGDEWNNIKNEYMNRCVYCGKKIKLTLDHIVPLFSGGVNDIGNAAPACKKCNSSKGTNSLLIFLYKIMKR